MRAAGLAHLSPTDVLSVLDAQTEELVRVTDHDNGSPPRFATALYAVYEPAQASLRVANAGHLPFLVRQESGEVEVVEVPTGTPLGVGVGGWREVSVRFPVGSTVAMFTDGLVESRTQDFDEGISLLAQSFSRLGAMADLCSLSTELLDAAGRANGHQDDIALLLLRAEPSASIVASLDEVVEGPREIGPARRAVADVLASVGAVELIGPVQHVLSELIANALEHGQSEAVLHVHVTGVRVVIEVTDQALARPVLRGALSTDERGRGLAVTEALCSRWGVRFDQSGKTVWAEFLRRP
jgi:anti-sigma regulatory factor (Ser/Thr protein kinase)